MDPSPPTPDVIEPFTSGWRPRWSGARRYVMVMDYLLHAAYFVAYGTDGHHTFGVAGRWSTDLEPFLARVRADGAEVLRIPAYPGTEAVQVVKAGTVARKAFLPDQEAGPEAIEHTITWPSGSAIRRCFQRLVQVEAAA